LHNSDTQLLNRRAASRYTALQLSEYTTHALNAAKLHNSDTQLLNRRAASRYTALQMSEYTTHALNAAKLHNSDTQLLNRRAASRYTTPDNVAMPMLDDVYDGSTIQARVLAAAQKKVRQTLSRGADAGGAGGAAGGAAGEGAASPDGPGVSITSGGGKPLLAALAALACGLEPP
jgi:hypothetical protein